MSFFSIWSRQHRDFVYVLYSTLLHLPTLRFHYARGGWDRTQNCCDFGIGSQMHRDFSNTWICIKYRIRRVELKGQKIINTGQIKKETLTNCHWKQLKPDIKYKFCCKSCGILIVYLSLISGQRVFVGNNWAYSTCRICSKEKLLHRSERNFLAVGFHIIFLQHPSFKKTN